VYVCTYVLYVGMCMYAHACTVLYRVVTMLFEVLRESHLREREREREREIDRERWGERERDKERKSLRVSVCTRTRKNVQMRNG